MHNRIEVVAGVLTDAGGRVLLSQRREGTHLAGSWEFPGGKCEPGEALEQALRRELHEELGIKADSFAPLISVPWQYPEKAIRLHVLRVETWSGAVVAGEGQALDWQLPEHVDPNFMPAADRPVLAALRLPPHYLITPADMACEHIDGLFEAALAAGERLLLLRLAHGDREIVRAIAMRVWPRCRDMGAELLLHHDIELALELGLGVHLRASQLREISQRPIPENRWLAASCHDAEELARARQIGVDFATLSPIKPTASHPDAVALGWERFAQIVSAAALPVYALGGIGPRDLAAGRCAGAQGVAGIRAFW